MCIFAFTLLSLCLIAAFGTIPDVPGVLATMKVSKQLLIVFVGMVWGLGMVMFGFCAHIVGHGLAFSLILGLVSSLGALVPLLIFHPSQIKAREGIFICVGVGIALIGVALTGYSGMRRERLEEEARIAEGRLEEPLFRKVRSGTKNGSVEGGYLEDQAGRRKATTRLGPAQGQGHHEQARGTTKFSHGG